MKIINDSPSQGPVNAPLAGGLVKFRRIADVLDEDAPALIASGHFREPTDAELKAAEKRAADQED